MAVGALTVQKLPGDTRPISPTELVSAPRMADSKSDVMTGTTQCHNKILSSHGNKNAYRISQPV
eukprot:1580694-Rhodomonas_salina.2